MLKLLISSLCFFAMTLQTLAYAGHVVGVLSDESAAVESLEDDDDPDCDDIRHCIAIPELPSPHASTDSRWPLADAHGRPRPAFAAQPLRPPEV